MKRRFINWYNRTYHVGQIAAIHFKVGFWWPLQKRFYMLIWRIISPLYWNTARVVARLVESGRASVSDFPVEFDTADIPFESERDYFHER